MTATSTRRSLFWASRPGRFAFFLQQDNPMPASAARRPRQARSRPALPLPRQPVSTMAMTGMIGRGGNDMQARRNMLPPRRPTSELPRSLAPRAPARTTSLTSNTLLPVLFPLGALRADIGPACRRHASRLTADPGCLPFPASSATSSWNMSLPSTTREP